MALRELETFYDIIFQDEELVELLSYFQGSKWFDIDNNQRMEIIEKINDKVAALYGYKAPYIDKNNRKNLYGYQDAFNWEISINESTLDDNPYEIIDTYFHELRHAFQYRAIENELAGGEYASKEDIKAWRKNIFPGNYFNAQTKYYYNQPLEKDAWIHGFLFARRVYFLNNPNKDKKDKYWNEYCSKYRNLIMMFVSDNELSNKLIKEVDDIIEDIYDSKQEDVAYLDKGRQYIKKLVKYKGIENLDFNEVATLLSPYAFCNLTTSNKVKLINRYLELNKYGNKKLEASEVTVQMIKLGKNAFGVNSSLSLINHIISYNFAEMTKDIVKGKLKDNNLSKSAIEEIRLNLYKNKDGKMINFIKDIDNLFLFSLQPYAKYESIYALKEFKKLKDAELIAYGENCRQWDYWERFYDNKLIFKVASEIFDVKFSEYYNNKLKEYRENIKNDLKGSKTRKSN